MGNPLNALGIPDTFGIFLAYLLNQKR